MYRRRRDAISKIESTLKTESPPILGISSYVPGLGKPGVEAVGEFLVAVKEIIGDVTRLSSSLRTRHCKVVERFLIDLMAHEAAARVLLQLHADFDPNEPPAAADLDVALAKMIQGMVADLAALLRILPVRLGDPRSYYKILGKFSKVPMPDEVLKDIPEALRERMGAIEKGPSQGPGDL